MTEPRRPSPLLYRLTLAPVLVAAMAGVLWADHRAGEIFLVRFVVLLVQVVGLIEFTRLCRRKGYGPSAAFGVVLLFLSPLLWWGWSAGPYVRFGVVLAGAILFLVLIVRELDPFKLFRPSSLGLMILGVIYVGMLGLVLVPPANVAGNGGARSPTYYLLFLFACAKGSDMAAFAVGKAFGRRKMAPRISPNKTWEGGIAGGAAGTALGGAILIGTPLRDAYGGVPAAALFAFALSVTIASQLGDLVESAIKRWAGAKDSGRLLPSFGGMLDMADSFFISVPVAFLLNEALRAVFAP